MKYLFIYGFLFPKRNIKIGVFSYPEDLFEGNTEENVAIITKYICEKNKWDVNTVKSMTFHKISPEFIKDAASDLLRPGNIGTQPERKSSSGSGDGEVQGR